MKMSDNLCDPKSEPGFLTNCRLCLNESDFPVVSIFDEKYKNDDLPRKIMLLTNIVVSFVFLKFALSLGKCGCFSISLFCDNMIRNSNLKSSCWHFPQELGVSHLFIGFLKKILPLLSYLYHKLMGSLPESFKFILKQIRFKLKLTTASCSI